MKPNKKLDLSEFLYENQSEIIYTWVKKLHKEAGPQYAARSIQELEGTISEAVEANYQVLVKGNYDKINSFIDKITVMRLETGFLLSDVQKAFELYRIIVTNLLIENFTDMGKLKQVVCKMNRCLAYTIHRFSDHFQNMHQIKILEQNKTLETMVQKRTAALEESEKKYKTLVEEITDGYFVVQEESIVFANQVFCDLHGYTLQQVLGRKFTDFVSQSHRKHVTEIYFENVKNKGISQVFEYRRLTNSGKEYPTEIHGKTTRFDHQLSIIGICRDTTDRVQMEQKVRENERMAYIGQITASLSHEIRNPLSAVKMNLQILNTNKEIIGNDKRRVELSVTEVIRLEKILNQMLDFAKPLQLKKKKSDIFRIIRSYIELLEMKFKEKELSVVTRFNKNISPFLMDEDKIGQAVMNILINAIETSEPFGKIIISASQMTIDHSDYVKITFADEGIGFAEIKTEKIFKPFFTTKTKGVGLGLANVKRIVEGHNGYVSAKKRKKRGASFSVVLPMI